MTGVSGGRPLMSITLQSYVLPTPYRLPEEAQHSASTPAVKSRNWYSLLLLVPHTTATTTTARYRTRSKTALRSVLLLASSSLLACRHPAPSAAHQDNIREQSRCPFALERLNLCVTLSVCISRHKKCCRKTALSKYKPPGCVVRCSAPLRCKKNPEKKRITVPWRRRS